MRHVYSVVRFVPDPARGESINIGIVAGSDDSCEWRLRAVENLSRARRIDDQKILPNVLAHIETIRGQLDEFSDAESYLIAPEDPINEGWLERLAAESANILQFTEPRPLVAESVDDALDQLWDELIIDPASQRFRFQKKHRAVSAVKVALRELNIPSDRVWERARIETKDFSSSMDFVIHDEHVVQLTNCWSFQLPDKDVLAEQLKAWAWTIRDLRSSGGFAVSADEERAEIERDVPIAVVFVPPATDEDIEWFEHGQAVFADEDVRANAVPYGEVGQVPFEVPH